MGRERERERERRRERKKPQRTRRVSEYWKKNTVGLRLSETIGGVRYATVRDNRAG